jgi:hypothetical protein
MSKTPKLFLFLDMDGVLNHTGKDTKLYRFELDGNPYQFQFSRKNIGYFNKLIDEIGEDGIDIVISSSWRIDSSLAEFKGIFKHMKIKGNIIGYTPNLLYDITSKARRGDEIDRYIKDNKVKNFIVLDDDNEMVYRYIKDRWVRSYDDEGFNKESLFVALEKLSK